MKKVALLLAACVAVAACGSSTDGSAGPAPDTTTPVTVTGTATTSASPTTVPPTTTVAPTTTRPPTTTTVSPTTTVPTTTVPTTTTQPPAPTVPPALRGVDIERIPTSNQVVALTFDAGANAAGLPRILDTLKAQQVPGTFFLTGRFAEGFPESVRAIVAGGHRVGNHSHTHPYFTALSDSQLAAELASAEGAMRALGADPRPLFRFPYGDRDARTIRLVNNGGYAAVRWTVDTLGWQGTSGGRSTGSVTQRVLDTATAGQIVLMHIGSHPQDGSTLDADALPGIIVELRERGYSFVTLDALLR